MKKRNIFKKTLALGVAGVLGITSIFGLTSCDGTSTELDLISNPGENLTVQTRQNYLADTEWKSISANTTLTKGTKLKFFSFYSMTGDNNDELVSLRGILRDTYSTWENFKVNCRESHNATGDIIYVYTYTFGGNVRFELGFTDEWLPECGCSFFEDTDIGLDSYKVYFGDTLIFYGDCSVACPDACDYIYCIEENVKLDSVVILESDASVGDNYITMEGFFEWVILNSFKYDDTVTDLQAPSISGTNTFTVNVDSLLTQEEILSHVSATDDTDTDPQIVVESSTYTGTKQIGEFYIVVHAVDGSGNVSPSYTLTINVKDSTAPTITTTERSIGNNEELTQADLLALFTATDNYYSSSEITLELTTNSYSSKSTVPGKYQVTAKATDPSGNYSSKSTYVTVFDATAPTITATNKTTGNNAKLSDAELKALFNYSDDVTGTSALTFTYTTNNYTANYNKVGSYQVTAKVTDEAGNFSSATATITVVDKTAPTITATNKTTIYNTLLSEAELKALFTYSDDVSATVNMTLTITSNTYSDNYNKLGTYKVTAKATDENGNEASATATITVVDNVKPVVTGADINITNATILTEAEIKNYYKATDEYDGELTFNLAWVKNSLETPEKVGVYSFTISATDSSNNPISQTFNLNVTDGIEPEVWLDNYFIVVDTNTLVTQELLVSYAAASLCVAEADIVSVDGSYDNSEAGIYILSAKLTDGSQTPIKLPIVEGEDIPTVDKEDCKYEYEFGNIFTGDFWANYASGWTNNFGWPHWATIIAGVLLLGSLVIGVRRKRK